MNRYFWLGAVLGVYCYSAALFYHRSLGYKKFFTERLEKLNARRMTKNEHRSFDICYILTCLIWPLTGPALRT